MNDGCRVAHRGGVEICRLARNRRQRGLTTGVAEHVRRTGERIHLIRLAGLVPPPIVANRRRDRVVGVHMRRFEPLLR